MAEASKKRVFIVDDNDLSRRLLTGIMRESPFEVVGEAITGESALEMIPKLVPDIVCLDVVLPGVDGVATLRTLKEQFPGMQVMMITAEPRGDIVKESMAAGASGFVVKPFSAARVLAALANPVS